MHTTAIRARVTGPRALRWWTAPVGGLSALGVVLAGASIGSNPRPHGYHWWLGIPENSYAWAHVVFYASVAVLSVSWAVVGIEARRHELSVRRSWGLLASWGAPLLVGTPVFGRDVYSYIAQGELARRGLNPYVTTPRVLGHGPVLSSIAVVWRDTTSPYGPLYVMLTHATTSLSGGSLMGQVIAFRVLELGGVVLLLLALPRVARHCRVDPGLALWLGVLSPLALFSAVASAHNDTLMVGLVVTAIALTLDERRRWAVTIFALAATIKLPALVGVVFVYVGPWREATLRGRARLALEGVALTTSVIIAVTEVAGYGWHWLSPSALRIPTELRVLTTPTVSLGVLAATALRALGAHVSNHDVVTQTQHLGEAAALVALVLVVLATSRLNATRLFGVALLVIVIASPTVWPWYFLWGLSVLAATSAQRSWFLAGVAGLAMLLVGPGGTPMLGGNGFYVSGTLVLLGIVWFLASGQWRVVVRGADRRD